MADIDVLSTHAVQEVLRELGPAFERVRRARLTIDYGSGQCAPSARSKMAWHSMVAIVTGRSLMRWQGSARLSRDSCVDIGRSGLGVADAQGRGQA